MRSVLALLCLLACGTAAAAAAQTCSCPTPVLIENLTVQQAQEEEEEEEGEPAAAEHRITACPTLAGAEQQLQDTFEANVWADKLGHLVDGVQLERDWSLTEARTSYKEAMDSEDVRIARCAGERYRDVGRIQAGYFWPLKWFPPVVWFNQGVTRALVFVLAILAAFAWFLVKNNRGILVKEPLALGENAPVGLFGAELHKALRDVRKLIDAEIDGHQMSGSAALSVSKRDLSSELSQGLPDVFGVEIGKYLPMLLSALNHFAYRLETSIAASGTEVIGYATLRRRSKVIAAWSTRVTYEAQPDVVPAREITLVARRLAYVAVAKRADRAFREE